MFIVTAMIIAEVKPLTQMSLECLEGTVVIPYL